jgi:hypothetical protein
MVVIIQFFYSFGILFYFIVRLSAGNYFEHQPIKIKQKFFLLGAGLFFKKGIGSQMGSPSVANSIFPCKDSDK